MKRIVLGTLFAALFLFTQFHAALADDLAGKWSGTLSAGEFKVSASVRFTQSGYRISAAGISSSGSYRLSGSRITLDPSSPPGFSTTTMSVSLKGDRCTIKGSVAGLSGTLTLKRSGGSSGDDPAEEPEDQAAPAPAYSPEDQAALERLAGRWTCDWQGQRLTLVVYLDGWAALLVDADGEGPSPRIYGVLSFEEGVLVIRQAPGEAEAEPLALGDLLTGGERPEAPLTLALPYEIDPEGLLRAGEEEFVFSAQPGAADYLAHPEQPDWKEEE